MLERYMNDPIHLLGISPVDGRYANKVDALRTLVSEYGLMRNRLLIEIRWLQVLANIDELAEIPSLSQSAQTYLENILNQFDITEAKKVKAIEATTNHDVKAIEYYLKEQCQAHEELATLSEFIHFACTSEDINNLSYALMLESVREQILLPKWKQAIHDWEQFAIEHKATPMLARTHGQAATPTTVGKEILNVMQRFKLALTSWEQVNIYGKFNGATGNYNAHHIAYPKLDWPSINKRFITSLGLTFNPMTTQIEPHDYIAQYAHALIRLHGILIDFNRDIWGYISLGYFKQKTKVGEVGSSTMPHKVNPIDFENSEGNCKVANALFNMLANELVTSRWQRDLVDSTLLRNLGSALAHALIALSSWQRGFSKLSVNKDNMMADLQMNWEVLAEALQTVMRRYGVDKPYEKLKALTRGKDISETTLRTFIQDLSIPDEAKTQLLALRPETYIGLAVVLCDNYFTAQPPAS